MKILVFNNGSASVKVKLFEYKFEYQFKYKHESKNQINLNEELFIHFKLYDSENLQIEVFKQTEKIHQENKVIAKSEFITHVLNYIKRFLKNLNIKLDLTIFRIVHGGNFYKKPLKITSENIKEISKRILKLAPIHNPPTLKLINKLIKTFDNVNIYGVFDTSFFDPIPIQNKIYGIPYEFYEKEGIQKYGFHGFSHKYVSNEINKIYKKNSNKIISCHLGSGSSVCAINGNIPVDTSCGFSPEENIISSTRCGEIDFSALHCIKKIRHYSDNQIIKMINFESGFLGISGYTKDMKILLKDYNQNSRAQMCIDLYVSQISKYIYQMVSSLEGIDILVFTGGIGCGSDIIRKMVSNKLNFMGGYIDDTLNDKKIDVDSNIKISSVNSKFDIWVIPTCEEVEMVKEVICILK